VPTGVCVTYRRGRWAGAAHRLRNYETTKGQRNTRRQTRERRRDAYAAYVCCTVKVGVIAKTSRDRLTYLCFEWLRALFFNAIIRKTVCFFEIIVLLYRVSPSCRRSWLCKKHYRPPSWREYGLARDKAMPIALYIANFETFIYRSVWGISRLDVVTVRSRPDLSHHIVVRFI
jgi:hypothetical protein